jgi:hypothetical protein
LDWGATHIVVVVAGEMQIGQKVVRQGIRNIAAIQLKTKELHLLAILWA